MNNINNSHLVIKFLTASMHKRKTLVKPLRQQLFPQLDAPSPLCAPGSIYHVFTLFWLSK